MTKLLKLPQKILELERRNWIPFKERSNVENKNTKGLNLLNKKNINEYNRESFFMLLEIKHSCCVCSICFMSMK